MPVAVSFTEVTFTDTFRLSRLQAIEGAANALAVRYDVDLDRRLDDLIDKIGAAQEADGYLYTLRRRRRRSC